MRRIVTCIAAAALAACGGHNPPPPASAPSPRVVQVATAPGVSIEVFDWGGSGRPLVFLGGGGHSAREFDSFAPRFLPDFRVLAISRRGSGTSTDAPPDSLDPLVHDIVAVLDSLHLPRAVLVGHSFAGVEMARFGETRGDRCAGLVYLDAAYDYTDPGVAAVFQTAPPPPAPPMREADSASVQTVQAYTERISGFTLPESEIRATRRFGPDGRLAGEVPSETQRRMGAFVRTPRWDAIACPSLGIYAVPAPPESWLPWYPELDPDQQQAAQAYYRAFGAWTAAQRAAFGRSPGHRVIEFPSSNHYFFLEKPDQAARMIRDFASGLP